MKEQAVRTTVDIPASLYRLRPLSLNFGVYPLFAVLLQKFGPTLTCWLSLAWQA